MYLTQGLHRSVRQRPGAPATIFGDRVRSFAEQADRVARLAGGLRELGLSDGDRVGILALNSDRYAELLTAVPWAKGVLNPINIRWSPTEIIYSLRDSGTDFLCVDDAFVPMVSELAEGHPGLKALVHLGDGAPPEGMDGFEELVAGTRPMEDARCGGDTLAGIFYTGGTTGFPKGVMLSHANLLTSSLGAQATSPAALPGGRTLLGTPMFHMTAIAAGLMQGLAGGTQVILPGFEPGAVLDAIARHRITTIVIVPTMLQAVVDHADRGRYDLSSVRRVLYGASPISEALLRRSMRALPGASFAQAYGMTELSPITTMLGPGEHQRGERLRSAGRAAAHAEVRVVDDQDRELPPGSVGEVVCRGGHVMLGYWNKPEETAEALRGGWMHTGDAGYLDEDGYVYLVDRVKDMIVTGGENVYSAEVENAVASHPAVAACAVIAVPDETWGERVHAVIVLHPGQSTDAAEIRSHCRESIASYKAPRTVEFVDTLPVSAAGKVLKRELREPYWGDIDRGVH